MTAKFVALFPYFFFGSVACFALAEFIAPRRSSGQFLNYRWSTNIALFLSSMLVQRICLPFSVVVLSETARRFGWGLLAVGGPHAILADTLLGVAAFDLWKYGEHRVFHWLPIFWRLHRTHHSDIACDFTTTERHHPLEFILAIISTVSAVVVIGISPLAVILYLVAGSVVEFLSHANIKLPVSLERALSSLIVTPGVHQIHHSAARVENDCNFGTLFTIWDRIFGSFMPIDGSRERSRMLGIEHFRDRDAQRLDHVLLQPFAKPIRRASEHALE